MGFNKDSTRFVRFFGFLACCLILANIPFMSQAKNTINDTDSVMPTKPVAAPIGSCAYNFEDTYSGTDSGTSPPTVPAQGYGSMNVPGFFGPTLQLQFSNFSGTTSSPAAATPAVPCDGHYEVTFSVELRNNSGTSCNFGENSMSVWVTTSDNASPNAYGCPVTYLDSNGSPHNSPSQFAGYVHTCVTFTDWVQCVWTNNFNNSQMSGYTNFEYYGVTPFPIYMYTPWWGYQNQSTVHSQYPGMCYEPSGCYEIPGQFRNSYQTAYCTTNNHEYKNVVFLHKGTQINAPSLASQMAYAPYDIAVGGYQECGFSVIGGRFKVVYIGP